MSVVDSIQKARKKSVADELILGEIRKQNPEKEVFFKKAQERGATPKDILDEIVKQNTPKEKTFSVEQKDSVQEPKSPPLEKQPFEQKKEVPPLSLKKEGGDPHSGKEGKTLLTQEAQEREEEMRNQFLRRVEAKERGENIKGDNFFSPENQTSVESSSEEMTSDINSSPVKTKLPKTLMIVVGSLLLGAFILLALNFL